MELTVQSIIKDGISKGVKNVLPLFVNSLLWAVTLWIPYFNVGTTIGLFVGVMTKIAKDEGLSMTEVFDPKYRKNMGEFFLTAGFVSMGTSIAAVFLFIPAIVIGIAWMIAIPLVIDKDLNPAEALTKSNQLTYGKKWTIFGGLFLLEIVLIIAIAIVVGIFSAIHMILGFLAIVAAMAVFSAAMIGAYSVIYVSLTKDM